jgi:hypothetical protein
MSFVATLLSGFCPLFSNSVASGSYRIYPERSEEKFIQNTSKAKWKGTLHFPVLYPIAIGLAIRQKSAEVQVFNSNKMASLKTTDQ